jgi:hypothetical protein
MAPALILPDFALHIKLASFEQRPANVHTREISFELLNVERPVASLVANADAVVFVDGRHHCIAYRIPDCLIR